MKKDLMEAYVDVVDSAYDDTYTQIKAKKMLEDTFSKYTSEDIKEEIRDLEQYINYLKKQDFYTHDYKELVQEDSELAFTPLEIYRLYLEKDLAIYSVLSNCTDEYLKDVIKCWVAFEYDTEAIMLVANYMNQKKRFSGEKLDEDIF